MHLLTALALAPAAWRSGAMQRESASAKAGAGGRGWLA